MISVVQVTIDDSSDRTITGIIEYDRDNGGTLVIPSGTSFPTSPLAKELFIRTDTNKLYRRNDANTAWDEVGGVLDHGSLTGLLDDDHTQYLLVNGTRAVGGDLSLGSNSITNVNLVDGVDVSAHATRHAPGGVDALSTAAPTSCVIGNTNQEGSATSFARSDHTHGVSAGTPVTIGTTNQEGSATSFARSDHVHAHGNQSDGSLHAACTTTTAGFMSATDKAKLDGIDSGATNTPLTASAPLDVSKATASVGSSTEAARADHKHDITTASATALTVGGSSTEGSATTLARSDHTHGLPAFGNTSGTFCEGSDARLSDDRVASGLRTATSVVSINTATAPTAGQVLTANSATDAEWKDAVATSSPLASVQARRTTTLTMPTTWTDLTFDTTDVENDATRVHHDTTNTDRIYVYESGYYRVTYQFEVSPSSTGTFEGRVRVNDSTIIAGSDAASTTYTDESDFISVVVIVSLSAGDYLTVQTKVDTSGTMSAGGTFTAYKMEGVQGPAGSGSNITVQDESTNVPNTPHTTLNFTGTGVSVTDSGSGVATISIPGSGVFGSEFGHSEKTTEQSTTSTSLVNYHTHTTPSLPAGTYRIGWFYIWNHRRVSNDGIFRVQVDGTTELMYQHQEPKDAGSDQRYPNGGFGYINLTAGTHTITLDFATQNSSYATYLYLCRIEIWRVS